MSTAAGNIPPMDGTLGATLIGAVLGTFLFGIETLQAFHFYQRYPMDRLRTKLLVAMIWAFELGHSLTLWHALYRMTVSDYGQIQAVLNPPRSIGMTVLFSALTNVAVQTFFSLRIRRLSGHWYITGFCLLLSAARFVLNMYMIGVFWNAAAGFATLEGQLHWAMISACSIGPGADLVIALSLCVYLFQARRKLIHYRPTQKMIDTLLLWSIETTALTSVTALLELILFLARRDLIWMPFFILESKLFGNSILAHLNGRDRFRGVTSSGQDVITDSEALDHGAAPPRTNIDPNRSVVIRMHEIMETTAYNVDAKANVAP